MSKPSARQPEPGEMLLSDATALVAALARVRAVAETYAELGVRLSGEDVLHALVGNHPVPLYSATRTVCVLNRGHSPSDAVVRRFGEWLAGKAVLVERARANAAEQRAAQAEDERDRLCVAADAVRALHPRVDAPRHGCCAPPKLCNDHAPECRSLEHFPATPKWPCRTIAALDGAARPTT